MPNADFLGIHLHFGRPHTPRAQQMFKEILNFEPQLSIRVRNCLFYIYFPRSKKWNVTKSARKRFAPDQEQYLYFCCKRNLSLVAQKK